MFSICSYIQNLILNLIETLKISIYSSEHTKRTKSYFHFSHFSGTNIFLNLDIHSNQRFMLIFIVLLILLRATQPN